MNASQPSDRWSDDLRLVSYCPVCETRYHPMEAKLLGENTETRLLHVRCRKCQHSILALVLVNQVGASSVGLLTDLSYEDVLKFKSNRLVSVNDVIDVHTTLEDGSWTRDFEQPKRSRVKRHH